MHSVLINLSVLFAKPTGIATYAINLFPHLQKLEPTLLASKKIDNFNCYLIPDRLSPERGTKGHLRRLLWTEIELPKIYQKLQSRLIFSPVPEAPIHGKCRFVVMVHDLIPLRFPKLVSPLTNYFRYYVPRVLARAEHVICNSDATARDITDFFGIPAAKIAPILLAHDSECFRPLNLDSERNRENIPYFLYIGRHDPYKNLHRLIDAFSYLGANKDYQLWLVGATDRRYTPLLETRVRELGLKDRVKFFDYVSKERLAVIINRAIALVFPSLWEGFGLPVLEAMACGTPTIASNISSLPEVTGNAGWSIDPYNTREIADAMKAIAEEPGLRSHLSRLGLERASQFSWVKTGVATAEILQKYF